MIDFDSFSSELTTIMEKRAYKSWGGSKSLVHPRVKKLLGFKHKPGPSSPVDWFESAHKASRESPEIKAMEAKRQAGWDKILQDADAGTDRLKAKKEEVMARARAMIEAAKNKR